MLYQNHKFFLQRHCIQYLNREGLEQEITNTRLKINFIEVQVKNLDYCYKALKSLKEYLGKLKNALKEYDEVLTKDSPSNTI